jgi:hypothetical protein
MRAQCAASIVDTASHRFCPLGGQIPVLDVPGLVILDHRQRVQVADDPQQLTGLVVFARIDPGDEGFQHYSIDVRGRRVQHMVLHGVERVECRHFFGFALQAPRH